MRRAGNRPPTEPTSAEAAYQAAVRRLARRPQSRQGLVDRLVQAGFTREAAEAGVSQVADKGYLDDREFAQNLVRRRLASRGLPLIARELEAKGVDEGVAAAALAQVDPARQAGEARRLAEAVLRRRPPADRRQIVQLIGPVLNSRGYPASLIHRLVEELSAAWPQGGLGTASDEP